MKYSATIAGWFSFWRERTTPSGSADFKLTHYQEAPGFVLCLDDNVPIPPH